MRLSYPAISTGAIALAQIVPAAGSDFPGLRKRRNVRRDSACLIPVSEVSRWTEEVKGRAYMCS